MDDAVNSPKGASPAMLRALVELFGRSEKSRFLKLSGDAWRGFLHIFLSGEPCQAREHGLYHVMVCTPNPIYLQTVLW
jgi:hypothetical protein